MLFAYYPIARYMALAQYDDLIASQDIQSVRHRVLLYFLCGEKNRFPLSKFSEMYCFQKCIVEIFHIFHFCASKIEIFFAEYSMVVEHEICKK